MADGNFGALFREQNKTNPKAPDYKGDVTIDGKKWALAGWIKQTKAGKPYLSLRAEEPREKASPAKDGGGGGGYPARTTEPPADPLGGDDIPFGFADYGTFPNF